jgi:hypothetical protein
MDEKIADLDCHLSHIRGEANWAKVCALYWDRFVTGAYLYIRAI